MPEHMARHGQVVQRGYAHDRVRRMQRRNDESPRHRCPSRDHRRCLVADLPNHQNIRVHPHERAQALPHGQAVALVDLDLPQVRNPELDRVLDGDG